MADGGADDSDATADGGTRLYYAVPYHTVL